MDLGQSATGSPVDSLTPGSPTLSSRKRKAGSSAGSRGVASLTPDQLAKKRANDREAQRAIRERTKATIEGLERKIRDLETQQPYQELQVVIRQKDAIQAENEEIRRRLTNILALIQPIVGAQGLTGETYPGAAAQTLTLQDLASAAHHNVQAGLAQPGNAFQQDQYMNGQQRPYAEASQGQNPAYSYADQQPENRTWHGSRDALDSQRDNLQRGLELNESGERLSFNFLLDSLGQRATHLPASQPPITSPSRSTYPTLTTTYPSNTAPIHTQIPKNIEPTCPLDTILLNFYHTRRTNGSTPSPSNATPSYPSVSSLLNPSLSHSSTHRIDPLSQLMTDIISKFPNISALPEQTSVLLYMFSTMRWYIHPTESNYLKLPEWMRPTEAQLYTPHPAWIDYIPWPRIRDKIISEYQNYPFENWFIPFTTGLSVNWPYEPTDCLLRLPGSGEEEKEAILNPVFERHISRLENWSLGPELIEAFPALEGTCNIRVAQGREPAGAARGASV